MDIKSSYPHQHHDERKSREQLVQELVEIRNRYDEVCHELAQLQSGSRVGNEQSLRALLDHLPIPIRQYGCDGIITYWNRNSERLYGYMAEEAIGQQLNALIVPPAVQPLFKEVIQNSAKLTCSGEFYPAGEVQLLRKDGSLVTVYSTHAAVCQPGQPPILYCFDIDLSEHKLAAKALRESEERFRITLENLPGGVFAHDLNGKILIVNKAAIKNTGYERQELLSMSVADIDPNSVTRDDGAHMWHSLNVGKSMTIESAHARKDGTTYPVEVHLNAVLMDNRAIIIAIAFDISERKHAEDEKEKLKQQLIQAQKMEAIGTLAGGIAHDFNNKLNVILGNAGLALEHANLPEPLHNHLDEIQKAALQSADLARQMLAYARKQTITPRVINLNEAVEGLLKMLQRLIGENIELTWRPGKDLWPVNMDPSQLDQVLTNLFVNARDAITDIGKVTIETANMTIDQDYCKTHLEMLPGEYLELTVSDDGCGMDQETMAHLFEPFFTTKQVGKGTGLGMATVYGIVKQNKGFADVKSKPGEGTTIAIYLPRHEGNAAKVREKDAPRAQVLGGNETLLLVEDEEAILTLIKIILERYGYFVLTASKPSEAILLAEGYNKKIDLLVTDVIMPEVNGRELSKQIGVMFPGIKVLFISGYTADMIAYQGILDPNVNFIQKPFSHHELAAKVREVLDCQMSGG